MTLAVLAGLNILALTLIFQRHGSEGVRQGLRQTWRMIRSIAPMLAIGMVVAAMAQVALPESLISRWLGDESGFTGILLGIAVGVAVPAGPYVVIPLLGSLLASGAGVGPIAAFLTAWSVIPFSRTVVWEMPFLSPAFAISRTVVALPFPFVAGLLAPPVYNLIT